jgi:small-conductance mechanosensitive channel
MKDTNIQSEVENISSEPKVEVANLVGKFSDYLPQSWQPYWDQLQSIPFLKFAIIVAIGYIVGKIIQIIIMRTLTQLTKRTKTDLDDELLELMKRPIFLTIFFFFLIIAVNTLEITGGFKSTLIHVLMTLLVLVWLTRGFKILHLLLKVLGSLKNKYKMIQSRTVPLFDLIGKLALVAIGSYFILIIWGINPTAWLASAGVIGLAVGFAAKDTLSNLFSGFFIIADTPYEVGNFVVLSSGERGVVTNVGMRSTRILTRDDVEITVPNAVIGNAKVMNESRGRFEKTRIRIKVGVAYGTDVHKVCSTLEAVANSFDKVCQDPSARVRMRGFGPSSLDFELLCWIEEPVLKGSVTHQLYMNVYNEFNAQGIEFPYDTKDIHIKTLPESFQSKVNKDK